MCLLTKHPTILKIPKYLDSSRPRLALGVNELVLFVTAFGEPMPLDGISKMAYKYIEKAKLGKSASIHSLCHACVTHLLSNGVDIRYIQQILNHSDLNSTQQYARVEISKLYLRKRFALVGRARFAS